MFLSLLPTENANIVAKHSILGKKRTLRETCIMSVLYIVSQEPQGKKRKNSCIWRSFIHTKMLNRFQTNEYEEIELLLPKRYIFNVFELLTLKNAKMDGKHSILGYKTLRETCIITVL